MSLEASFDKAAEGLAQAATPEGQVAPAPEVVKPSQGQVAPVPAAPEKAPEKGQADREWDGKPDSLPNELKQDPKAIQRAYTKKAMALADAEKRLKEYEGLNKQEIDSYRQWKQEQEVARQRQLVQQPPQPTQLTTEQFEYIKNNPEAMQQYVQSLVNAQINQAAQTIMPEIQQMKYQQSLAEWERTIADFGEIHPDMWEMHEAGMFKPILEDIVKSGGTLDDAYNKCAQIRDALRAKAVEEAQVGIRAKKEGSSLSGTTSASDDTVFVENSKDALDKAFDLAFSKKEYVPKDATIVPRGRVKVRK